jgi:PemK-like, MazF-like toxin of type II toxin-antitoxin system
VTFRRWDVVSVPFPFIEGHATKRRPALVVSTDAFHRAHRACFGAMITTARHMQDVRPDDIPIVNLAGARGGAAAIGDPPGAPWDVRMGRSDPARRHAAPLRSAARRNAAPALVRHLTNQ